MAKKTLQITLLSIFLFSTITSFTKDNAEDEKNLVPADEHILGLYVIRSAFLAGAALLAYKIYENVQAHGGLYTTFTSFADSIKVAASSLPKHEQVSIETPPLTANSPITSTHQVHIERTIAVNNVFSLQENVETLFKKVGDSLFNLVRSYELQNLQEKLEEFIPDANDF